MKTIHHSGEPRTGWPKLGAAILIGGMLCGAPAYAQDIPRLADGHPDFSGLWVGGVAGEGPEGDATVRNFGGRGGDFFGFEEDNGLNRMAAGNKPIYRPEHWETIRSNDYWGNWLDPELFCLPDGVPKVGAPAQIFQTADTIMLIYQGGFNGSNDVRIIPTDGRPHNVARVRAETWNGTGVGNWEGDTLVIETIGFTDESWLHKSGYIHGYNMRVVETLKRDGNRLTWQATVYDDEYLQEPWVLNPVNRNLNTNPDALLAEDLPCDERDVEHIVSHTRSG